MRSARLLIYGLCLGASLSFGLNTVRAADKSKKSSTTNLTEEQQKLRTDLLAKYDTNKDGKLDKNERKNISSADKAKLKKAGLNQKANKKKASKKDDSKSKTGASDNASSPVKTQ